MAFNTLLQLVRNSAATGRASRIRSNKPGVKYFNEGRFHKPNLALFAIIMFDTLVPCAT